MPLLRSLSGRILLLTFLVVMLAEVLIFVPSVARFRLGYLEERLVRAHLASLNVMGHEDGGISDQLAADLLSGAEVLNVVVQEEGRRQLVLSVPDLGEVAATHDLRDAGVVELISDALATLVAPETGVQRIIGYPPGATDRVLEIAIDPAQMIREMRDYGWRILRLSLIISAVTGGLVFLALRRFVVRPITRVIDHMAAFSADPDNPDALISPQSRLGEVADAERALQGMQMEVRRALHARARLAALGEAVAKISHDLRNLLASTQLLADRLEGSDDPLVARVAPKFLSSLDRAIRLCQSSLDYGKAEETPPVMRRVALAPLLAEVVEGLGLGPDTAPVRTVIDVPEELMLRADPEQLYRVLANLMRNAREAIDASGQPGTVTVAASTRDDRATIEIGDNGPGMPEAALRHLFKPFRGGARRGGTGLGLAIASELVHAHGGELDLVASTTMGTAFRIVLPARAPDD